MKNEPLPVEVCHLGLIELLYFNTFLYRVG